ncbi:MAG: hypothetical protein R2778_11530 [Saprospiraceae bacterium]
MSLWQDKETAYFMELFYKHLVAMDMDIPPLSGQRRMNCGQTLYHAVSVGGVCAGRVA